MKILAPIDRVSEIEPLLKLGADEFFCGVVTDDKTAGSIRSAGDIKRFSLPTISDLKRAVSIIKKNKKKIFLAINNPYITPEMKDIINKKISIFSKMGIDGFIISDLDLMDILKKKNLKVIASSFTSVKNEESAKFFIDLGVDRIIIDRQIKLDDLKAIKKISGKIELESFIMASACRSLPHYCFPQLSQKEGYKHIHPCLINSSVKALRKKRNGLKERDLDIIGKRLQTPKFSCGACAIYWFDRYGVDSIKIVGRGFSLERKIDNLRFIKMSLEALDNSNSKRIFYRKVRSLFRNTFGLECKKRYCYYPHFFDY